MVLVLLHRRRVAALAIVRYHKKPVVNAQATEAAREKQERIKEQFKEWVWSDDSRRERLCRLYNDTFNLTRLRTFNGDHLTLSGASQAVQLHGNQKAGVWRLADQARAGASPRRFRQNGRWPSR